MVRYGMFPVGLGNRLSFTVHEAMAVRDYDFADLMVKTERAVVEGINEYKQI